MSSSISSTLYTPNQSSLSHSREERKGSVINIRVTDVAQEVFQSPLAYFGNRSLSQSDYFQLIQSKANEKGRFRCFYDLFAGSGSISLYAMSLNVAESYHINDALIALKLFWKAARDNPETLIEQYHLYLMST